MKAHDFLSFKNWVVAGDVNNTEKYAFRILNSLKAAGFNVCGVNPRETNSEVYININEVPYKVDVLDLCINARTGIDIIRDASKLGIKYVLIQPGAGSDEIISYCLGNDIIAINGCALAELSLR